MSNKAFTFLWLVREWRELEATAQRRQVADISNWKVDRFLADRHEYACRVRAIDLIAGNY